MLKVFILWLRLVMAYLFFIVVLFLAFNFRVTTYVMQQAAGQLHILLKAQPLPSYLQGRNPADSTISNLELIAGIKRYSVDSLGYKPTANYETIFDQQNKPVLWVVTASPAFSLEPYEWSFPVVGDVSYKGFFEKHRANLEYISLVSHGYDATIRTVTAWSTLGWFGDPLLSNTLSRSKGSFCNLLFHELFHATYYKPGAVNLNENLANFIAHKATMRFLRDDTTALRVYLAEHDDEMSYKNFLLRQYYFLKSGYENSRPSGVVAFKRYAMNMIADSIRDLSFNNDKKYKRRAKNVLRFQNAYFVDLRQYESLQDSLEIAFNKIYRRNIKKMVQDLTAE